MLFAKVIDASIPLLLSRYAPPFFFCNSRQRLLLSNPKGPHLLDVPIHPPEKGTSHFP
jgi:hypothetical protein